MFASIDPSGYDPLSDPKSNVTIHISPKGRREEAPMVDAKDTSLSIAVPDAPRVQGLRFRRFAGEADYPAMLEVMQAAKVADKLDESFSLASVESTYRHLTNCDPNRDMLFAEVDGNAVGYGRGWWEDEWSGTRTYSLFVHMHPDYRKLGIRRAMLRWLENRFREVAAGHQTAGSKIFQAFGSNTETDWTSLLESEGYSAIRWGYLMHRSLNEAIVPHALPEGLEVRPVREEDVLTIWHAAEEAFRDHWGHGEWKEEYLAEWRESPTFQPHLWQVAWDGDEVTGTVLTRVDEAENVEYKRKRGYTETICVRKPWRGRGLAKALITRSLFQLKEMGMTEAAHGVDAQNATGALQLYEGLGYRPIRTWITYRKPLSSD
jgi:mycothiol synthase